MENKNIKTWLPTFTFALLWVAYAGYRLLEPDYYQIGDWVFVIEPASIWGALSYTLLCISICWGIQATKQKLSAQQLDWKTFGHFYKWGMVKFSGAWIGMALFTVADRTDRLKELGWLEGMSKYLYALSENGHTPGVALVGIVLVFAGTLFGFGLTVSTIKTKESLNSDNVAQFQKDRIDLDSQRHRKRAG